MGGSRPVSQLNPRVRKERPPYNSRRLRRNRKKTNVGGVSPNARRKQNKPLHLQAN